MPNPRAGKILQGRYRLRSILAEGGMGVVWQAERVGIERPVVVKFLQTVFSDRPGAIDRFEREARATARLNHPNCVQLIDFGLDEGQPYLVVEFVEGQTLSELLDRGPLEARRAVRIVSQVLAGLEHAHDRNILHRDLKPANLMIIEAVGYEDFVKILDFGLAKILGEVERREVTVHGVALGTPGYMSPEQAAGMPADLRADVYSTGAVLYHLLTGAKVFDGDNVHSILRKHREETPPPPRSLRGNDALSAELDAVVARAMHRDPAHRYATAADMRGALAQTPEGRALALAEARPVATPDFADDDPGATRVARGRLAPPRPVAPVAPVAPSLAGRTRGPSWPIAGVIAVATLGLGAGSARLLSRPSVENVPAPANTGPAPAAQPAAVALVDSATPAATPLDAAGPALPTVTPIAAAPGAVTVAAAEARPAAEPAEDEGDDGASEDVRQAPEPPVQAPRREVREVRTLGDVRALIRRGETDQAVSGLYQLRRKAGLSAKERAEIATLLGHLYFDRRWVSDALKEYRYALSLDVRARNDATIVNNTVRALGDRATAARARRVLIDSIGRAAIPALRRAADRPDTRRRAEEVLAKLGAPRR